MPQMAPINWLSLFIVFCMTLVLFSTMNYYLTLPKAPKMSEEIKISSSSFHWKW